MNQDQRTRVLALCADDFGAGAGIDSAVLALVAQGRLSEVSCIVNHDAWAADAATLAALPAVVQGRVRIGLHWNLTEGAPLSTALRRLWPVMPSLPMLIANAHLHRLPLDALAEELDAQLAAFAEHAGPGPGHAPAHIDGHQHVHHLPGLSDLLATRLDALPGTRVRHTGDLRGPGFWLKRQLIAGTGGRSLGRWLVSRGRAANVQLLGAYDFAQRDYRRLMRQWLARLPPRGGMVFCHPGQADAATAGSDPIAAARAREFAYLSSDAFADDLAEADVKLASRPFMPAAIPAV